jgi:hypothetical protein
LNQSINLAAFHSAAFPLVIRRSEHCYPTLVEERTRVSIQSIHRMKVEMDENGFWLEERLVIGVKAE